MTDNLKYSEAEKKVFAEYDRVCTEIEQMKQTYTDEEKFDQNWRLLPKGSDHTEDLVRQIDQHRCHFQPIYKRWWSLQKQQQELLQKINWGIVNRFPLEREY